MSNAKENLATALHKFRAALVQPKKDAVNPFFKSKYATLDAVVEAVDAACEKSGLSYVQMTDYIDGAFVLVTTILHGSGESVQGKYILPATGKSQDIGAAVTYARRYALSAAFGIVADEDDDGNTAAPVVKQPTKEESEQFKNYKAKIKSITTHEELETFGKTAGDNMKKLPESLATELRAVYTEKKQSLTKGE